MALGSPISQFVCLIFLLMNDRSIAPVAVTKNANDARAVSESNGQSAVADI